ncbi:hypothetical protein Rsub_01683 [Raphidocelis subcapitata]|uniref:Uncharacterized protein n=1 Tax=Raphidocelis subcapitata TaxID=307507 RepID=A0A2V0NQB1_9CHLO|nr:hypothetical protein Rsub_01683 [Raphidocelis subcapitata]|eukprot:GBF88782.1 hypothetical protein Rsub_01683 [Raphidocelis subcapitata]
MPTAAPPPEQAAFDAATAAVEALCREAARCRRVSPTAPADAARAASLLASAGALRRLLRDRLLVVPACCQPADCQPGQQRQAAAQDATPRQPAPTGQPEGASDRARRQRGAAAARLSGADAGHASAHAHAAVCPQQEGLPPGLAAAHARRRAAALEAELASAAAALARLGGAAPPGRGAARLLAVVRALRAAEGSLALQARLARAAEAAALADCGGGGRSGCSEGSFAYGSTPLASWLAFLAEPAVMAAARAAMAAHTSPERGGRRAQPAPRRRYMVWGSSLGWLPFYGGLALGWPSSGVELLPCLVEEARRVAAANGVEGVDFSCGDLRGASLAGVGVLQTTEVAWDAGLVAAAAAKICAEAEPGTLVVDYTGGVVRRIPRARVVAAREVAVSWGVARMHAAVLV